MFKGIDVSHHNGKIDWEKVKLSGVSFAIIRAGWAGYEGYIKIDDRYHENMLGAITAGLDVGVYVYVYTKHPTAARIAAMEVLKLVQPYRVTYPICFDVEETADSCLIGQGKAQLTATTAAFLELVEASGYYGMLYTYTHFAAANLDMTKLANYDLWIADYREPTGTKCPYPGKFGMWQYTVMGTLGIKGRNYFTTGQQPGVSTNCDLNIAYKDYPAIIIKAGLNNLSAKPPEPSEPDYKALYKAAVKEHAAYKAAVEEAFAQLDTNLADARAAVR